MIKRQKINLITSKKQFYEARLKELRTAKDHLSPEESDLVRRKELQLKEGIRYCNSLLVPIIQDLQFGPNDRFMAEYIGVSELFEND